MFRKIKSKGFKMIAAVLAAALGISAVTPAMSTKAAGNITVNVNNTYQTIQGFGGMNHPCWIKDLTSDQINTAFGNGDNQLGMSILRIHVDENKNNWSKELATAKAAMQKGAIVFATPWNPPASMTEPIVKNGKSTKRLKTSSYGEYAAYLNEFVSYMKNNGVDLYAISIQNEPDWGYEWTWWEPEEIYQFTKNYAGKINCRVISAESFSYNKSYYDKILNDPAALNNVDIIGTHFYGTQTKDMAYPLLKQKAGDKPLWMTEVYVPDSNQDADVWPAALAVSNNIHHAMINGFQSYVWWYIRRSYGPIKENGQISKRGYCMAQYSKFVRPGYVRVDTPANPQSNVYVSAYKGGNQAVVVVVNQNSSEINQNFTISGAGVSNVVRYRTSAYENLAKSDIPVTNGTFNVNLPGNSVSTFVCTLGNTTNTGNTDNQQYATLSDGWYYIKNVNAQKYLQVQGNTGANGQNVELETGNGSEGQKWYLTNKGNGQITLKSALGYMLDVTNGKNADCTNIELWSENGGDPQVFMLKDNGSSQYGIVTKVSSGSKGLDASNKGTADGTNVQQYSYYGGTNQLWTFEQVTNSGNTGNSNEQQYASMSDGWYYIKNVNAQKYLQVQGNTGANGQNVELGTGTGVDGQKWYLTNKGNGQITLKSALGYMLDVTEGKNENCTNIELWSENGKDPQVFMLKDNGNSQYGIVTKVSNGEKGLDASNKGTTDGTNIQQYSYYGGVNQLWIFEQVGSSSNDDTQQNQGTISDGWYYIKNTNAQKYLQVKDNTGANGQNVEIGTGTGVKGQKWYLTNTSDGYVTLKNGQGYMLDVQYGKNEDGTNIQTYSNNGADAQKFKIKDLGDSKYGILTKVSSDKKSLDVYNFGTSDGSNVCQWAFYQNTNQTWIFEPCNN